MKHSRVASLASAILLLAPALLGDSTVRYKNEIKLSDLMAQVLGPAANSLTSVLPATTMIRVKGKLSYSSTAYFDTVNDYEKQVITLVDAKHNQYATVYMKDYEAEVLSMLPGSKPAMAPDAQKVLDSMKTTFSSEKTGKTDKVLGIEIEETVMRLSMSMPAAPGSPASSDTAAAPDPKPMMEMVIHIWTVPPSEMDRVPALKEFAAVYGDAHANASQKISAFMNRMFSSMPGIGSGFSSMMEKLAENKGAILRTELEMYMPQVQEMMAAQAKLKNPDQTVDTSAPFFQVKVEADVASGEPIADSVFEVPRDSHLVSVTEFLKEVLPNPSSTQSETTAAPAATEGEVAH